MMLNADQVKQCFLGVLDREPESDDVLAVHQNFPACADLISTLINSAEFRARSGRFAFKEKWVLCDINGGKNVLWVDLGDSYVSLGCLNDAYETKETAFMKATLSEGNVVIDIGANIGWFTILSASLIGPRGRVYAFEPRDSTYLYLQKSVAANSYLDRVRCFQLGLSNKSSVQYVSWSPNSNNRGGTYLSSSELKGFDQHQITTVPLDMLQLTNVDFIKIDVEGFESRVLNGAIRTLLNFKPIILCEINFEQLIKVGGSDYKQLGATLADMGYDSYFLIDGKGSDSVNDAYDKSIDVINIVIFDTDKHGRAMEKFLPHHRIMSFVI